MTRALRVLTGSLISLMVSIYPPTGAAFDDTVVTQITYPPWFKQTFYDLGEDLSDARDSHKRGVLLFFSTQGCSYCHVMLQRAFAVPTLSKRLRSSFDVIALDLFDDAEITDWDGKALPIKQFAVREGVQFSPTLVFYDTEGKRLLRLIGYYAPERLAQALDYLDDPDSGSKGFKDWLAVRERASAKTSPARTELTPDPLFAAPPYRLNRSRNAATRPLMVLFEQHDCASCVQFHEQVLSNPQVRELLSGFDVVRLDADDISTRLVTPTGASTTPAQWRDDIGFTRYPALAWFDERGQRVLETDALVLRGRLQSALGFVRDRAYADGWTYQRYARQQTLKRLARERSRVRAGSGH